VVHGDFVLFLPGQSARPWYNRFLAGCFAERAGRRRWQGQGMFQILITALTWPTGRRGVRRADPRSDPGRGKTPREMCTRRQPLTVPLSLNAFVVPKIRKTPRPATESRDRRRAVPTACWGPWGTPPPPRAVRFSPLAVDATLREAGLPTSRGVGRGIWKNRRAEEANSARRACPFRAVPTTGGRLGPGLSRSGAPPGLQAASLATSTQPVGDEGANAKITLTLLPPPLITYPRRPRPMPVGANAPLPMGSLPKP